MDSLDERPYCIWYPGLATEDTYRELARRYPSMRYQVGRACAVGGFQLLYLELDLLPDVSIAEEAREAKTEGSAAIFQHIMSQPVRYAVMDDYTRTVNLETPRPGANLNGNTALRPPLSPDKNQADEDGDHHWVWTEYFDITEEWPDETDERPWDESRRENADLPREFTHLLYSPLPLDLPTVRKDALIVMAAYEGNVDRYHRLRRPKMVRNEAEAIVRGIYHNTSFARYIETDDWVSCRDRPVPISVSLAITARHVMVNDLSRIKEDPSDKGSELCFPRIIWHPLFPRQETLRELIRRRPNNPWIHEAVALACIAADYQSTYDALNLHPSWELWQQALKSPNGHYTADLKQRAASGAWPHIDADEFPDQYADWYPQQAMDMAPTTATFSPHRRVLRYCYAARRHMARYLGRGGQCCAVGAVYVRVG
jgi:hypothetical protein